MDPRLCALCRGRGLCGLSYCPIIARAAARARLEPVSKSRIIGGPSPPSVFVGRYGYPLVRIGPSVPPVEGDTTLFDLPEAWSNRKIEEVLSFRLSMITGEKTMSVKSMSDRFVEEVRLLALSSKPTDVEMILKKPPMPSMRLSELEPPQGPRSQLIQMKLVGNPSIERPVEKVYEDTDMRAVEAIAYLYTSNIPVSRIQRILSVGGVGLKRQRKIVPTRWSITAVDSSLSRLLLKEVKGYETLDEILIYLKRGYGNLFAAILLPEAWSYEWMEAWWPGSTWNPGSSEVVIEGDSEGFGGRKTYPEIGGCYYASMLATLEHLRSMKRQATAVLLREIYPSFDLPIGVWFVREMVRSMFREGAKFKVSKIGEVLEVLDRETELGGKVWFSRSRLLKEVYRRRKIDEFFERGI
ncbi:MAG: Nre family DNA repair protein [Fervidicoccaceae archaeon]